MPSPTETKPKRDQGPTQPTQGCVRRAPPLKVRLRHLFLPKAIAKKISPCCPGFATEAGMGTERLQPDRQLWVPER